MRFIRLPEVRHRVGYSRATIYRKINEGTFPKPCELGGRAVAWVEEEIDGWMQMRIEHRHAEVGASPLPQNTPSAGYQGQRSNRGRAHLPGPMVMGTTAAAGEV